MTRRDDPLDEVVHLVPVISLGQCTSDPFRSDVKQGEMLLFNEPLPLIKSMELTHMTCTLRKTIFLASMFYRMLDLARKARLKR